MTTVGPTPGAERPSVDTRSNFPVVVRRAPRRVAQAVGVMPAGVLVRNHIIPRRNYRERRGYQRPISPARVNKLVADLTANRVDLPTALLLNLRDFEEEAHLVEEGGMLFFRSDGPFYVVDGQHRIEALAKLIERAPQTWSDYPIPFVCLLGADEFEEMTEFYVVNSTAKSVRTDLAYDLLRQRAEDDPSLRQALLEQGEYWKVEGKLIAEQLADSSRLWKGRIRFPGEPLGDTVVSSSGMVSSFRALLVTPYFEAISMEDRVKVLGAYWAGISNVLPEAFENPSRYALQKATGVQVMHKLLIVLIESLRSLGDSVLDPGSYESLLRDPLLHLEGDTASGDTVRGTDFWRVGALGAAGSFSNNAGRRVLTARMKGALPRVKAT